MSRPTARGDVGLVGRLVAVARPDWAGVAVVHLLGTLATPLALLAPVPLAVTVDSVLGDRPLPGFLAAVLPSTVTNDPSALPVVMALLLVAVAVLAQVQDVAGGRPVLAASTGQEAFLPTRPGLRTFHDLDEVADGARVIQRDRRAEGWAARTVAADLLDHRRVLPDLLAAALAPTGTAS